jgi:hypothetical protein
MYPFDSQLYPYINLFYMHQYTITSEIYSWNQISRRFRAWHMVWMFVACPSCSKWFFIFVVLCNMNKPCRFQYQLITEFYSTLFRLWFLILHVRSKYPVGEMFRQADLSQFFLGNSGPRKLLAQVAREYQLAQRADLCSVWLARP